MNSNSIPNAYCALLELLSHPSLIPDIRAELTSINLRRPPARRPHNRHPRPSPPLLRSLYY
jgi:hypothetical protein